jgi:photosystem II stability/assembly factor-like uncharacterized protein
MPVPRRLSRYVSVSLACFLLALAVPGLADTEEPHGEKSPFDHLSWRNVGPVNMSGRVADVEGVPGDPRIVWVGAAAGGVWKSTDGGLTFDPVMDDQPVASIGDLGVAPSNPNVVYVGSGEANVRNSVSSGNGVYKTTDGGQSWRHVGLDGTRHISRVLVHPDDPETVFVGALGSVYGPSDDRGVYRSIDGGDTWEKVLYLDERHGVADMDLDPSNPNVVYAAMWRFERKPWTFRTGSREGGVWKSTDGGDTWEEIGVEEGAELPDLMGRIAVKVAPSNPSVVYVMTGSPEGTLFRSDDRGEHFRKVSDDVEIVSRDLYYTDLRVDPADENRVYAVSSRLQRSIDGGRTWQRISRATHVDYHSLWIDPTDPRRMWQGQDGGIAVSYDRGASWEPIRNLPLAQFYQVYADEREPFYFLGGGLQDNGTWYGPSRTREPAGILPDDWRMISFGDAYWVVAHPDDPDLLISEFQAGGIVRTDMSTRQQVAIGPQPRRNDGGPVEELPYRFNWNSPIVASPHDGETVYFAGNVVFRSRDFGETWEVISPDLTTDEPEKQGPAGGPAWHENTTAEYHTTIISLAESPAEPGVIWAGTDDGNLQVTRDGGETWTNVIGAVPGVPAHSPVSHVEPSRAASGTAYAAFDRHMFDDLAPHLFVTEDHGATWRRLPAAGLPEEAYVHVVREDPKNHDLLYAGTDLGLFASWDRGRSFRELDLANLPTVPVHDLLIHPTENDLIAGTHGRALWVFDDATPIQRWEEGIADEAAHLFPVRPALRFPVLFTRYGMGDKTHTAPNPPYGALIAYHLGEAIEKKPGEAPTEDEEEAIREIEVQAEAEARMEGARVEPEAEEGVEGEMEEKAPADRLKVEILDAGGTVIRTYEQKELPTKAGVNRFAWDLAAEPPAPRNPGEGPGGNEFFGPPRGPEVLPGTYTVRLTLDGASWEAPVEVRVDPLVGASPEALRAQHEAAVELSALRSAVNRSLRALDVVAAELAMRKGHLERLEREVPPAVEAAWKAREEEMRELAIRLGGEEGKPFWSQSPALERLLSELAGTIDSGFRAPTAAQAEYLVELRGEVSEALAGVERFLTEGLPGLNAELESAGLGPVLVPEPVEVGE